MLVGNTRLSRSRKLGFLLVILCSLVASLSHAQSLPVLHLASVDNLPPYIFVEDEKLTGLSIDIIHELARRGQFEVEIHTYPWARVLLEVEQGTVDGAFSAYMTEERKKFCLYTGIVHYDELRIAVKRGREFPFTGIGSLYGRVIGKGRQVFVSKQFNQAVEKGRIHLAEADDMKMVNIKKLHEGRLDAVIGSPEAMLHYARVLKYDDILLLPGTIKERIPAYLILSKGSNLKIKSNGNER